MGNYNLDYDIAFLILDFSGIYTANKIGVESEHGNVKSLCAVIGEVQFAESRKH